MKRFFFVLVMAFAPVVSAHFPMNQRIGFEGFGFFPRCQFSTDQPRKMTYSAGQTVYIMNQLKRFSWENAQSVQPVDVIVAGNYRKYANDRRGQDFPNLGIYEREIEHVDFSSYRHQWNQYIRYSYIDPLNSNSNICWLEIIQIDKSDDFYVITGR